YITLSQEVSLFPVTWIDPAPPPVNPMECGVNLQPKHGHGWPEVHPDLTRAGWVRFPFLASPYHYASLEEAFVFYDPVIRAYNHLGVKVLLVLTHETYGEGRSWPTMTSADWEAFIPDYVEVVERIAAHYGDGVAGYEIWNEGNAQPNDPAAVHIPPKLYARLLDSASKTIRAAAPEAKIILGGLLIGSEADYIRQVRAALHGRLPVDAIGVHPYAFGAPNDTTPFSPLGDVDEIIKGLNEAAPGMPLWLTEVGAIGDNQPGQWSAAARYLRSLYQHVERAFTGRVPVVIWYGWSDAMHPELHTNGLVTRGGQPKSPLFETFFELCN
ncbi:MAG: glycoside hydrolase family 5 protein, partial [Anaerolineae bacterium]|nr:glycoside hydrolase family 5 protein [Anaerolineae bacterium]